MSGNPADRNESTRALCARLGIQREAKSGDQESRDEVLRFLSRDMGSLEHLAESRSISLWSLSMSELLPGKIAQRVLLRAPADKTKCDERNAYFHKDIGELIDQDRIAFSQIRLVGKKAVSILAELIAIHRETFKFTTMLQPAAEDLKASDEVALIGRVVDAIHNDVKARRKLLAMFPAPTP